MPQQSDLRPSRSLLYMPGSNARAIAKARGLDADGYILDLEDAVAPEAKDEARALVVRELAAGGFGDRRLIARCNPLGDRLGRADLEALARAPIEALLVPKVDGPEDVLAAGAMMDRAGFAPEVALWVMVETPRAVLGVAELAAAGGRLGGLVLGLNDLAKDTGMVATDGRAAFLPVLTMTVLAARANGLVVLDGVCNAIDDEARLAAEAVQARDFGFDGKTLIHPAQVAAVNRVFAPAPAQVAEAQAIVAAFADPAHAGRGALRVEGKMVERLHLAQAERLLARAQAIAVRGGATV
jgi:citrate lyase subunit beta/citryl-CoA lyase